VKSSIEEENEEPIKKDLENALVPKQEQDF
jgi:hypothetical protein